MIQSRSIGILLVEDTPEDALLLEAILASAATPAFRVTHAESLAAAERALAGGEFDALLLDLSLPESRGLETARRALRFAPAVPIVVLTGMQDEQLAIEAMQEGVQDYLVKQDLGAALLTRSIRYAIERKRREIEYLREVAERRLAEQRLDAYTRELERSNRALQEFAYVASHDLQEPLRKIRTFGDRLRSRCGEALGEQGDDYLERMQGAAARMQTLIEDLLAYSRLATQGQEFQPVDLTRVAGEVLGDLSSRIEQTGADVRVEPLPVVEADPVQMRQLLQNLIANAVKFHRPEVAPRVRVGTRRRADGVEIQVKDNGIGFDPQFAERIFAPFHRLHGQGKYEGNGMGLAICRRIVERHGGEIEALGTPGEGAEFVVRLPLRDSRND